MENSQMNAVVSKFREVAPGLIILQIQPDEWELPNFKPGQYIVIGLPGSAERIWVSDEEEVSPDPDKIIKRPYSISSSSVEKEYLELYITLIRSGKLTPRVFALKEGSRLFLAGKAKGLFTLDNLPEESNVIMIATGTGIAPYMSMIRTEFKKHPDRKFTLIHGSRHSWDLGYRAELSTLQSYFNNFTYIPVISRPERERDGWSGQTGYVQDVWKAGLVESKSGIKPTPSDTHIFLCGAPGMTQEMLTILEKEGFKEHKKKEPGEIHLEKFW